MSFIAPSQHALKQAAPVDKEPTQTLAKKLLPGLLLCAAGGGGAILINSVFPGVSALLIAILLGMGCGNLLKLPAKYAPGVQLSAKKILRAGIVLLGLQISLSELWALGWRGILLAVAAVLSGFLTALLIGKLLGLSITQRLLIASGFGICGAAAVAAVDGVLDDEKAEHETVTALALVVLCGTSMIFLLPAAAKLLGMSDYDTGMWAGASVHEVAQVVAIGGSLSLGALTVAVLVKLMRVLLLAPVMVAVSLWVRRSRAVTGGKLPPLMPLFVLLFIVMMLGRSVLEMSGVSLPAAVLSGASWLQTGLLATAMFALGLGVRLQVFRRGAGAPLALAVITTAVIAGVTLLLITL